MELSLLGRVLLRFSGLVALGTVAAVVLALLSFYKVSFDGVVPTLTPSKPEVWQATASTFLTQPGFPIGAIRKSDEALRFIGIAPLYARLANSDAVTRLMVRTGGPLGRGEDVTAIGAADTTYGAVSGLPLVTIIGTAPTPARAVRVAQRLTDAFRLYVRTRQDDARISESQRVDVQVINAAADPELVVPRKKTLPIVVFLAVMFATIALAVVLENLRPRTRREEVDQEPEPGSTNVSDVRRLA